MTIVSAIFAAITAWLTCGIVLAFGFIMFVSMYLPPRSRCNWAINRLILVGPVNVIPLAALVFARLVVGEEAFRRMCVRFMEAAR